jgi:hypothetical protein
MNELSPIELGAWIGKGQAFGLMRNRCSAEQAACLKQIRDRSLYQSLGLTWENFCRDHLGISRSFADKLIQRFDEFGAEYFRLSEIMRISPETYRAIEPAISDQHIEIDGERLAIAPENGPRIRKGVAALRHELARAQQLRPTCTSITDLQIRFDGFIALVGRMSEGHVDECTRASLKGLVNYSMNRLTRLARELRNRTPDAA